MIELSPQDKLDMEKRIRARPTTAETPTMRERLARSLIDVDPCVSGYHQTHIDMKLRDVDAILRETMGKSRADVRVSELAKGPDMRQDLNPEEIWQLRKWWVQSILNETKD